MSESSQPRKALGLWTCTALVVGNMIGSGIFLLPASLAIYGGISLAGWVFTAAGAWVLALLFAGLAKTVPRAGGPYAYSRAGFGDFAGFLVAWGYWISLLTGNAAIAVAMVSYSTVFWPALENPLAGGATAVGHRAPARPPGSGRRATPLPSRCRAGRQLRRETCQRRWGW